MGEECIGFRADSPPASVEFTHAGLPDAPSFVLTASREVASFTRHGLRLTLDGDPRRFVPLPADPSLLHAEVLWSSSDAARALVWSILGSASHSLLRHRLELVDLEHHSLLARTEACAYFAGAMSVLAEPTGRLLLASFHNANPVVTMALVDLQRPGFVALAKRPEPRAGVCTELVHGPSFAIDSEFGELIDAERRRARNAVLKLDGTPVAALAGDYPPVNTWDTKLDIDRREVIATPSTRVIVTSGGSMPRQVCAGVMRLQEGVVPSADQPRPARCLTRCSS